MILTARDRALVRHLPFEGMTHEDVVDCTRLPYARVAEIRRPRVQPRERRLDVRLWEPRGIAS